MDDKIQEQDPAVQIIKNLADRCSRKIDAEGFTVADWVRFRAAPKVAIHEGMRMGYKMGLDDCKVKFQELKNEVEELKKKLNPE